MLVFYIQIISVYIFSLYARLYWNRNKIVRNMFIGIVILILSLVAGLRNSIGDTEMYVQLFKLITLRYQPNEGYESGFILFFTVLKNISGNPQFMLLVTSFIINVLNICTIKRYNGYFELVTFMYLASGYYLVTMNGLRQSLAAAVMFACTNMIIRGNKIKYIVMVVIMCTFHSSALILIPIYFVVRNEAWSKRVGALILLFLIGLVLYEPLMNTVFDILGNTKFGEYKNFNEGGANIIRVAVYTVPVILAFIKRTELKEKWSESNIFVNMALLNLIIMFFSLNSWIFARLTIYFQIYNFTILAFIIQYCTTKKERKFLYICLVTAYFIFFWYEQSMSLHMQYTSKYKLL